MMSHFEILTLLRFLFEAGARPTAPSIVVSAHLRRHRFHGGRLVVVALHPRGSDWLGG